jgi:hypothetical protein
MPSWRARCIHFIDAPAAEIRHAPVADLSVTQHGAQGAQGLFQVHAVVVAVQVEDVDMVGLQAPQAGLDLALHPAARVVAFVHPLRHGIAQLGRQHPVVPLSLKQFAQHGLGRTLGVDIGRVDEIHALCARIGQDPGGLLAAGLVAEHHGAQAQRRHLQVAAPQPPIRHGHVLRAGHGFSSAMAGTAGRAWRWPGRARISM